MDWDLARVFLAVAARGRLSVAAQALNASPATVSRKIKEFEDQIGAAVIARHGRGYRLTEFGREVARRLDASAGGLDQTLADLRAGVRVRRRVVRINSVESLAAFWLPSQLAALQAEEPDLDLDIRSDFSLVDPRFGEADIVLRLGQKGSDPLLGRVVGPFEYGFFEAPGRRQSIRYVGAMADTPMGLWSRTHGGEGASPSVACDSIAAAVNVLQATGGRAALPAFIARLYGWSPIEAAPRLTAEIMLLRRRGVGRRDPVNRIYQRLLSLLRTQVFTG